MMEKKSIRFPDAEFYAESYEKIIHSKKSDMLHTEQLFLRTPREGCFCPLCTCMNSQELVLSEQF